MNQQKIDWNALSNFLTARARAIEERRVPSSGNRTTAHYCAAIVLSALAEGIQAATAKDDGVGT